MGLRGKLVLTLFALLCSSILAVSIVSLDRTLRVMAEGLVTSGDRISKEIFEQMRGALGASARDPAVTLRADRGLRNAMEADHAFGAYVVYVRIVGSAGAVIVGTGPAEEGHGPTAPGIDALRHSLRSAVPLRLLPALWSDHLYEASVPVVLNGRPFGAIKVGLSTGLISADVRRLSGAMLLIALGVIIASSICATALGTQFLRPVQAITSGVERLAAGGGELKLEIPAGDELATLADKFNQLSRRIRSEREQWESERGRLVDVFRSITDAVLLLDSDGSLLFANHEAQKRLGLENSSAGSEGKPLALLLGNDHPLMQLVAPALSVGGDVHDVAVELPEGQGSGRFLLSIFSLGQGPSPAGLLVMLRDLAQMNELETVVDYSSRLARLGGLLSGVAHQIRTPLNSMNGQLELLRQETGGIAEERIERVRREMRRVDQAIEALMRFMRPQELKAEEIALNDLLQRIGSRISRPDVKVEYELDSGLPRLIGDGPLLSEALQNIAENAVQAMPQGGVLKMKSSHVDGIVEVTIADHGIGIPPQDRGHIFELYFTTKKGGSGLGLPLAMRAIDLHNGSINVESEVGAGTAFKIRLPIARSLKSLSLGAREI
jgi:signal transduction histidine kinase